MACPSAREINLAMQSDAADLVLIFGLSINAFKSPYTCSILLPMIESKRELSINGAPQRQLTAKDGEPVTAVLALIDSVA